MKSLVTLCCVISMTIGSFSFANAPLTVTVSRGTVKPIVLALMDITPKEFSQGQVAYEIMKKNFYDCGLFKVIDPKAFIQTPRSLTLENCVNNLDRQGWGAIGVDYVAVYSLVSEGENMRANLRLIQAMTGQLKANEILTAPVDKAVRLSHKLSDQVYQALTQQKGYFDTSLAYIAVSGRIQKPTHRLCVQHRDGRGFKFHTDGSTHVTMPRFSNDGQKVAYLDYGKENFQMVPSVHVLDLKSGKKVPMGRYKGMTFAPRFTPDDRGLIVANAKDNGGTQLMYVDLRRAQARPITHTKGSIINTSPTLSPDGKFIIFVSDRTGRCALYKKALNDWQSEATRISFAEGSYAAPAWSPRGDLIGFTKVYGGLFSIGVMNPDGSGERILTSNYHSEGAEWAPNGRRLIFYRQFPQKTGDRSLKSRLFTIDLTGHHERRVPVLSDKRLPGVTGLINPAWSPSLPLG